MTVSKNPPLTEDQIRQSAEAEARHAAAQASRNSQLDYLIAQQRQQQAAAALETIFGSEEDRFKAAASKIEDSAHRAIEEQDRQVREVGEEISPARDQFARGRRPDRGWLGRVRRGARAARGSTRAAPSHSCSHSVDQGRVRAAARDRQRPRRRGRRSSPPLSGAEPLTMKSVSHSEARWAMLPAHVIRCNATRSNGGRCKREAEDGAVVCDQHGGAAPQVRRRAAERLIMSADQAAQKLVGRLEDTEVPFGVRAKIAQDLLDRAGLIATQVHQIIPTTEDPVMRFFEDAFSDPNNWEENPQPDRASDRGASDRQPDRTTASRRRSSRLRSSSQKVSQPTTRRREIAEMIKSGAFDRKPGQ